MSFCAHDSRNIFNVCLDNYNSNVMITITLKKIREKLEIENIIYLISYTLAYIQIFDNVWYTLNIYCIMQWFI